MKKLFFTITLNALMILIANSQVFVGGSLNFDVSTGSQKEDGVTTDKSTTTKIGVLPKIGYFLNEDLAIGAVVGIDYTRTKTPGNIETINSTTEFYINPFLRYYAADFGQVSFFGEAQVLLGFGRIKEKAGSVTRDRESIFDFGIIITPALSYSISDNIDIEASIGNLSLTNRSTDLNGDEESNTNFNFRLSTELNLGFIYNF